MEYTPENISGLLIRSRLLSPEQVRTLYRDWLAEGKEHRGSTPHYLKWMVNNHYLTEYQAALLAHGHADNFFLDEYKILHRLGRGRMAGVYKAVHELGQTVAIKVLPPSKAKDSQLLARFRRESRLAMKFTHPNVVRAFQVGETNGLHYLVMEYLEGETLEEVLQRRKQIPYKEAVRLMHHALEGLQHIHEQGLIHRDLKPANLMLVPGRPVSAPRGADEPDTTLSQALKILDIGLGREIFEEVAADDSNIQITGEGVLLGTPDYLAPEQARDPRNIDIRSDIYSLGCVLYHCLAGEPPFRDANVLNLMVRHATEIPPPVADLGVRIPDGLQQVLDWMLAKAPDQRYATPERAAQAMELFMVAGAVVQSLEEKPQMRKYLTWLETNKDEAKDKPAPGILEKVLVSDDTNKRRLKEARDAPVAAVPAVPAAVSFPALSFENVVTPPTSTPKTVEFTLSRRDWFFMGVGGFAVTVAVGIGFLLAKMFG